MSSASTESRERVRKVPSGRWQASYLGPDTIRYKAPTTFESAEDAEAWLADRRREINSDDWTPPTSKRPVTFGEHAERWYYRMGDATPTSRAQAYGLLGTILGDAVQRRLINPCHIRGAGMRRPPTARHFGSPLPSTHATRPSLEA